MLTQRVTGPRAWSANTIDERGSWYGPPSDRCLAFLDESIRRLRENPRPITEHCVDKEEFATCLEELRPVREAMESLRGFAILRGLMRDRYSPLELQACYWLIGGVLGHVVEQDVHGTMLYHVWDTGQDVRHGARFSVTNAESSFHTDNSFGSRIVDYVGLLCLQGAKKGA